MPAVWGGGLCWGTEAVQVNSGAVVSSGGLSNSLYHRRGGSGQCVRRCAVCAPAAGFVCIWPGNDATENTSGFLSH